eukprot:1136153-Amorphochlora_amoeboformis.AAC.3
MQGDRNRPHAAEWPFSLQMVHKVGWGRNPSSFFKSFDTVCVGTCRSFQEEKVLKLHRRHELVQNRDIH